MDGTERLPSMPRIVPRVRKRRQSPAQLANLRRGRHGGEQQRRTVPLDVRAVCSQMVDDPAYRAALAARLQAGTAGQMEPLIWMYSKGRPRDTPPPPQWSLDPATLAHLTDEELAAALRHAEQVRAYLSGRGTLALPAAVTVDAVVEAETVEEAPALPPRGRS